MQNKPVQSRSSIILCENMFVPDRCQKISKCPLKACIGKQEKLSRVFSVSDAQTKVDSPVNKCHSHFRQTFQKTTRERLETQVFTGSFTERSTNYSCIRGFIVGPIRTLSLGGISSSGPRSMPHFNGARLAARTCLRPRTRGFSPEDIQEEQTGYDGYGMQE